MKAVSKPVKQVPAEKLELYTRLIETNPGIELKGASMPYTSVNGHMFTFINETGLVGIRLPEKERIAFLEKYDTRLYEAHGTVLKEYATVPEKLLENTKELKEYLNQSYNYVASLKPKPSKKKS